MTDIEVVVQVVDEPTPVVAPTATDTAFLLARVQSAGADEFAKFGRPADAREAYPTDDAIHAYVDTLFGEGTGTVYLSDLDAGFDDALDLFPPELGPGQVVAPGVTGTAASASGGDVGALADWAWENNRVALLNGAVNATDAALINAADDVIGAEGGRNAAIWADWLVIPGFAGSPPRQVPASLVVAGMISRNDKASGNPGLAAAGEQGVPNYARGIVAERTKPARDALNANQVNTFKTLFGQQVRNYAFLSLADLDRLSHWWDLSGARVVMSVRAREAAVAESFMWKQIDGQHILLDRYEGALRGELKALWDLGALFGEADRPAYSINISAAVNPLEQLQEGEVHAEIRLRTSPPVRRLNINIVRRQLTQEV